MRIPSRLALAAASLLLVGFGTAAGAQAASVVDQSQTTGEAQGFGTATNGGGHRTVCQSFVPAASEITGIDLMIGAYGTYSSFRDVEAFLSTGGCKGEAGAQTLASHQLTTAEYDALSGGTTLPLSTHLYGWDTGVIPVTPGQTYYLGIRQTDACQNCLATLTASGNPYVSGNLRTGTWTDAFADQTGTDLWFRTHGNAPGPTPIKVAVILADLADVTHADPSTLTQPCKLLDQNRTYASYREYFEDMFFCVNDYYDENSYGTVQFEFTVFDKGGAWYILPHTQAYYADDKDSYVAVDAVTALSDDADVPDFDESAFQIAVAVHAGLSQQESLFPGKITTGMQPWLPGAKKIFIAETRGLGTWAHEIGHAIGTLTPNETAIPDLYKMGSIGAWDIMATGSLNDDGKHPPQMSSYAKGFMGWLKTQPSAKSEYGEHAIYDLETRMVGDDVVRYNLEDTSATTVQKYYLLETRSGAGSFWDSQLLGSTERKLVLYRVNEKGFDAYGYDPATGQPNNQFRKVTIPGNSLIEQLAGIEKGILSIGQSYRDFYNLVKFTAESQTVDQPGILANIEPITSADVPWSYIGALFNPEDVLGAAAQVIFDPTLRTLGYKDPVTGEFRTSGSPEQAVLLERLFVLGLMLGLILCIFAVTDLIPYLRKRIRNDKGMKWTIRTSLGVVALVLLLATTITYLKIKRDGSLWGIPGPQYAPSMVSDAPPTLVMDGDLGTPYAIDYVKGLRMLSVVSLIFALVVLMAMQLLRRSVAKEGKDRIADKIRIVKWLILLLALTAVALQVSASMLYMAEKDSGVRKLHRSWPFSGGLPYVVNESLLGEIRADLDLHVRCPDGRHVGMNYATGAYDVQIADAITNGDNLGAPEWIFFPPTPENSGCVHSVSAHDNQAFLAANPDLASVLGSATDSYEIYARYIDPASGIFTSSTLQDQIIAPGEVILHAATGTNDVQILPGVPDTAPPVTTASASGTPGADGWYTSDVTVILSASDLGSGVSETLYSLDGGVTYVPYPGQIVLTVDGVRTVTYYSIDGAGNAETPSSLEVKIDRLAPETEILSGPASPTYDTSAVFSFASPDAGAVFECALDAGAFAPCVSSSSYASLAYGAHTFSVRAVDPAGNADPSPATYAWTVNPAAVASVTFLRHTVGQGANPGSTKTPVVSASVKAFSKASGSCAAGIGFNPHDYGTILDTCAADGTGTTDSGGLAQVGVASGSYLLLSRDPETNVVSGVSSGNLALGETVDKFLQVIVRTNGTSVSGKTTTHTGSLLHVIEPEYIEWNQTQELYPFVFDAPAGDWGVTVTVTPPEGFTADYPELSTDVNNDYKALQFTLTDIGSCWECGTSVDIEIRHQGRTIRQHHSVQTPMTESFVKRKGLTVGEMEARGVRVEKTKKN